MPLVQTRGAASAQGFGEFAQASAVPNYIEDVFSCFLYTGNGSTQTITNNIDLSTNGGLVWIKQRNAAVEHFLYDTARGATKSLSSNDTTSEYTNVDTLTAFGASGFTLGSSNFVNGITSAPRNYVSWTFRKQPKFFDVVTYTGNGTSGRTVAHNLGSTPGCVMIKTTSASQNWLVYHRSLAGGIQTANPCNVMYLNGTDASLNQGNGPTNANATSITLSDNWENSNGVSYVMYLFAHNAGGFGLTGTDNVISCGSYGANTTDVNLGYEPQWIMIKNTTSGIAYAGWAVFDNMRGLSMISTSNPALLANSSTAEYGTYNGAEDYLTPTATGFKLGAGSTLVGGAGSSGTWIYIAIRRGPMKVPTSGTQVYNADTTITNTTPAAVSGFVTDLMISTNRTNKAIYNEMFWSNRLTANGYMSSTNTTAEQAGGAFGAWDTMNGSGTSVLQSAGVSDMAWMFKRAPSFFDVVCYTGTGVARTVTHNLGAVPELMIVKQRGGTTDWVAYVQPLGNTALLAPNLNIAQLTFPNGWNNTSPTSTEFTVGISGVVNASAGTYVAYLFATCAGVSKVGSYTGNGSSQTINCGFTGGARFVLIKATSTTGDWMVADSARGIVAGSDPYLELNNTNAEVTGEDWLDTDSTGFVVNQVSASNANTNGVTYIFLAIA